MAVRGIYDKARFRHNLGGKNRNRRRVSPLATDGPVYLISPPTPLPTPSLAHPPPRAHIAGSPLLPPLSTPRLLLSASDDQRRFRRSHPPPAVHSPHAEAAYESPTLRNPPVRPPCSHRPSALGRIRAIRQPAGLRGDRPPTRQLR